MGFAAANIDVLALSVAYQIKYINNCYSCFLPAFEMQTY
jgi:hypothetical protein